MPKIGEPIYLAKWETDEDAPRLLHIQSIADVELFGIGTANYLNFVMDRPVWEQRYGFNVGLLQVGPLASPASFAWPAQDRAAYGQLLTNMENLESAALFQAQSAGRDVALTLAALADCERQGLGRFEANRDPGAALGITRDCISRLGPGSGPPPGPPAGFPRTPNNVQVVALSPTVHRITWEDTPDETGFRIYEMVVSGPDQAAPANRLIATNPPNATSYDASGRGAGLSYCYSVSSFNPSGESPPSRPVCSGGTTPGAPAAPTNLRVTPGPDGAHLDWIDTSTNEVGFRVLRNGQPIALLAPNATSFVDASPVPPLCYAVVAFNNNGEAPSIQVCQGGGAGLPPSAPTNLRLTPVGGGNALRLEWTDTSNNEDGFRIVRGGQVVTTVGPNTTSIVDGGIVPVVGCYTVVAFNGSGEAASGQVCP